MAAVLLMCSAAVLHSATQWKDTLIVARDGTGDYRTLTEAMEGIRAFMDYKVTVLIKNGLYKEKVVVPSCCRTLTSWVKTPKRRLSLTTTMPTLTKWVLSAPIP